MHDENARFALYNFVTELMFVPCMRFIFIRYMNLFERWDMDIHSNTRVLFTSTSWRAELCHCKTFLVDAWVGNKLALQTFTQLVTNSKAEQIESQWTMNAEPYLNTRQSNCFESVTFVWCIFEIEIISILPMILIRSATACPHVASTMFTFVVEIPDYPKLKTMLRNRKRCLHDLLW